VAALACWAAPPVRRVGKGGGVPHTGEWLSDSARLSDSAPQVKALLDRLLFDKAQLVSAPSRPAPPAAPAPAPAPSPCHEARACRALRERSAGA